MTKIDDDVIETAREIAAAVREQNWKNGGCLTMDIDDAERVIAGAIMAERARGATHG